MLDLFHFLKRLFIVLCCISLGIWIFSEFVYKHYSNVVIASNGSISGCGSNPITHRPADLAHEGEFYFPGELDSFPSHQEGLATRYGTGETLNVHTSSGEIFDPSQMTAASWFYPLGTIVKVTDVSNGNQVVVRINDRGPNRVLHHDKYHQDVIIDLTAGAMRHLDPNSGKISVIVEPVCP